VYRYLGVAWKISVERIRNHAAIPAQRNPTLRVFAHCGLENRSRKFCVRARARTHVRLVVLLSLVTSLKFSDVGAMAAEKVGDLLA
jgi:hypothetical protein